VIFQKLSLFTQQEMGTQLSSELVKVKAVRKRSGAPPQLQRRQYNLAQATKMISLKFKYALELSPFLGEKCA